MPEDSTSDWYYFRGGLPNQNTGNWILKRIWDNPYEFLSPTDLGFSHLSVEAKQIIDNEWTKYLKSIEDRKRSLIKFSIDDYSNLPTVFLSCIHDADTNLLRIPITTGKALSEWLPIISLGNFINEPSQKSLSNALRTLAANYSNTINGIFEMYAPWPLSSICSITGNNLSEFLNSVDMDELGDTDDWIRAERRWLKNGITIDDIDYFCNSSKPYDRNISDIGFPFGTRLLLTAKTGSFSNIYPNRFLAEWFRKSNTPYARQTIADVFLMNIFLSQLTSLTMSHFTEI